METTQRTEQQTSAERRRRELLEAADRVVLRDGPGASMNAIAAEAGITKPILYRHFGDKGGLYAALAKRHTDALLASLRAALDAPAERRERVESTLDTYLAAIEARPQVYRFLMHPSESVSESTAPGEQGFYVGKHSAPCCAAWARSSPRSSRSASTSAPAASSSRGSGVTESSA